MSGDEITLTTEVWRWSTRDLPFSSEKTSRRREAACTCGWRQTLPTEYGETAEQIQAAHDEVQP